MTNRAHKSTLYIVGAFPPPLHGLSAITRAVANRLDVDGLQALRVNTALPQLHYGIKRILRLFPMIKAWNQLLFTRERFILYLPLSGGWGQIYDLLTILLARLKKSQIVFHHHSTAYLYSRSWLSAEIFALAGKQATHIVLCEKMRDMLQQRYGCKNVRILSNLAFFPPETHARSRQRPHTIGFLSNITKEKGGETILSLASAIKVRGLSFKVVIAGPCQNERLAVKLQQAVLDDVLEWRGAVYGDDKAQFWQDIDVFVFPTQYQNEAEPLVVWEAMAAGIPVIAYARGCIPSQVRDAGKIVPVEDNFVAQSLTILEAWRGNHIAYKETVERVLHRYKKMHTQAEIRWQDLLGTLENAE